MESFAGLGVPRTILLEGDGSRRVIDALLSVAAHSHSLFAVEIAGDGDSIKFICGTSPSAPAADADADEFVEDEPTPCCDAHAGEGWGTHAGAFDRTFGAWPSIVQANDMLRAARRAAASASTAMVVIIDCADHLFRCENNLRDRAKETPCAMAALKSFLRVVTCDACWAACRGQEGSPSALSCTLVVSSSSGQDAAEELVRLPRGGPCTIRIDADNATAIAVIQNGLAKSRGDKADCSLAQASLWLRATSGLDGLPTGNDSFEELPDTLPPYPWLNFHGFFHLKRDLCARVLAPFVASIAATTKLDDTLRDVIYAPLSRACAAVNLKPPRLHTASTGVRGVLLLGGAGAGKSTLARALAAASGAALISVSCPRLLERYLGDSEAALRGIFAGARASAPCVLVLDDIDAIASARGGGGAGASGASGGVLDRLVATLLNELDGVGVSAGGSPAPILVVATLCTHYEATDEAFVGADVSSGRWGVDAALLRPGRFEVHIRVSRPRANDRAAILAASLSSARLSPQLSLSQLSRATRGWTAAQTAALLDEAALRVQEGEGICLSVIQEAAERALRVELAVSDLAGENDINSSDD